jgi:hypothetical protein
MKLVTVQWNDAHATSDPVTVADLDHDPLLVTTAGWLLRDDEKGITLANERYVVGGVEYFRGKTFIPRGMIQPKRSKKRPLGHADPPA